MLQHIRQRVTMICTDSAADEMLAAEMMRQPVLASMGVLTPNLRVVLRDKAHSSRRLSPLPSPMPLLSAHMRTLDTPRYAQLILR